MNIAALVPTGVDERVAALLAPVEIPAEYRSPEQQVLYVGEQIRQHMLQIKVHIYSLGPLLQKVRDEKLWQYDPNYNESFKMWLAQPDIGLSVSRASDIIGFCQHALPLLQRVGYTQAEIVSEVDESKLRMLIPTLREAASRRNTILEGLKEEAFEEAEVIPVERLEELERQADQLAGLDQVRDLVEVAKHATVEDIRHSLRPSKPEEVYPDLPLRVEKQPSGHWKVAGIFTAEQMEVLDRRARPIWLDRQGQPATKDWTFEEEAEF